MKKHVVTGPIWRLAQCHPTITNSYSYSWIRNQMFLLVHFEIQELWVIIKKHKNSARKFPGDFANFQKISWISRRKNNSSRFPWFPGVLDTLDGRSPAGSRGRARWGLGLGPQKLTFSYIMHKYFVYWDLRQHFQHKNTLQHFQEEVPPPFAHAWSQTF